MFSIRVLEHGEDDVTMKDTSPTGRVGEKWYTSILIDEKIGGRGGGGA